MRAANIPLSGPLIQEAALEFGKKLNKPNFKASNGWLESYCKSKNISFLSLNGESVYMYLYVHFIENWSTLRVNFSNFVLIFKYEFVTI